MWHGDIYQQHQPICTSLGCWIITFHLAMRQKTLNAIMGDKHGCHYGSIYVLYFSRILQSRKDLAIYYVNSNTHEVMTRQHNLFSEQTMP